MTKDNPRTKDALIMLCYVCALGAFGAFFRWLQMQIARDAETGMMDPSVLSIILPLIIIAAAIVLWQRTKALSKDDIVFPTGMSEALRGIALLYLVLAWIIGIIMIIGGILTISAASLDRLRGMYVLIAVLGILSGLAFPLICSASRSRYSPSLVSVLMTIPIIMYCVWLIACYRENANNPNVWNYAIEILTICTVIIALFYVAGYAFGRPQPKKACYCVVLAAFMCMTTLSDSRYMGLSLIILGTGLMLLMYTWLIVKNRCPSSELQPEKAPEPKAAEPEPEEDTTVIKPTPDDAQPEPTIQAPTKRPGAKPVDEVEEILKEYKNK